MRRSATQPPKPQAAGVKKAEEEDLVRKLLGGELISNQEFAGDERAKYLRQATGGLGLGRPPGATTGTGKVHGGPVERFDTASLEVAVDKEKHRRKVLDAMVVAMDAQTRVRDRARRPQPAGDKGGEAFYFAYEKLHEQKIELEIARRGLCADKFSANRAEIQTLLQENTTPQGDIAQAGDQQTFDEVQQVLQALFVRRYRGVQGVDDLDSGAYMALLKHKLNDAREQIDILRKKVRDLSSALKVASVESKSAQLLLNDRTDDVQKLRSTVSVLQQQLRNYKHRTAIAASGAAAAAASTTAAGPGSKEELLRDLDQLRTEYQDMASVNVMLEKEVQLLRTKLAFGGVHVTRPHPDHRANPARHGADTSPRSLPAGSNMRRLLKAMDSRRRGLKMLERVEVMAMAANDRDAGATPAMHLSGGAPRGPSIRGRSRHESDGDGPASQTPAPPTQPPPSKQAPHRQSVPPTPTSADTPRPASVPPRLPTPPPPTPPSRMTVDTAPSPRHSPAAKELARLKDAADAVTARSRSQPPLSKSWVVLRQKVVNAVALSRADVLRREEMHVKRLRHRAGLLQSELSSVVAERDDLRYEVERLEKDLEDAHDRLGTGHRHNSLLVATPPRSSQGERGVMEMHIVPVGSDDTEQEIQRLRAVLLEMSSRETQLQAEVREREAAIHGLRTLVETLGGSEHSLGPAAPSLHIDAPEPGGLGATEASTSSASLKKSSSSVAASSKRPSSAPIRAPEALGLRAAGFVVPRMLQWMQRSRVLLQRSAEKPSTPPVDPFASAADAATSADIVAILSKGEQALLLRMVAAVTTPDQASAVATVAGEEAGTKAAALPGSVEEGDEHWHRLRQMWLQLIAMREAAWFRCPKETPIHRKARVELKARVIESYAALAAFELESSRDRPALCTEGIAPRRTTNIVGARETAQEVQNLRDALQTYTAQEARMKEERDALRRQLETAAVPQRLIGAPQSALHVIEDVVDECTIAEVGARYNVTHMVLLRQAHQQAARAGHYRKDHRFVPLRSKAAVHAAAAVGAGCELVVRHVVQPHESLAAVAARYSADATCVCRVGSLVPALASDRPGVVDVIVDTTVAVRHAEDPVPESPVVQTPATVFAVLEPSMERAVAARSFNCPVEDIDIFNDVLERGSRVSLPLLLTRAVMARVPALVAAQRIAIEASSAEEREAVAKKLGIPAEALSGDRTERGDGGAAFFPITSLEALKHFVPEGDIRTQIMAAATTTTATSPRQSPKGPGLLPPDAAAAGGPAAERRGSVESASGMLSLRDMEELRVAVRAPDHPHPPSLLKPGAHGHGPQPLALRRGSSVNAPLLAPTADDAPVVVDHHVAEGDTLLGVAKAHATLREDVVVPNFAQLSTKANATWGVRLRTTAALRAAHSTKGCNVHCVLTVQRSEPCTALCAALGVPIEAVRVANPELRDLTAAHRLRMPLLSAKAEEEALKRTGEFYATLAGAERTLQSAAAMLRSAVADIILFDAVLDPAITRYAFLRTGAHPKMHGAEHRVVLSGAVTSCPSGLTPGQLDALRRELCADITEVATRAAEAATDVAEGATGPDAAVVHFVGSEAQTTVVAVVPSRDAATAVAEQMQSLKAHALPRTRNFVWSLGGKSDRAPQPNFTPHSVVVTHHQFPWRDCKVLPVSDGMTLEAAALRTGFGVLELLAYNTSVHRALIAPHPGDNLTPMPAGRIAVPTGGTAFREVHVGEMLAQVATRFNVSCEIVKKHNPGRIPLAAFTASLRIPGPIVADPSVMFVKTLDQPETLAAFCKRIGITADAAAATTLTVPPGTTLVIPGFTDTSHRVAHGETLQEIAAHYGVLEDELRFANAGVLVVAPNSTVAVAGAEAATTESTDPDSPGTKGPVGQTFVRHVTRPGDTVASIAALYEQPVEAVLALNEESNLRGQHRAFVRVSDADVPTVLRERAANLCTIVPPPHDGEQALAKQFNVPLAAVQEATQFAPDGHSVVPITSNVASAVVVKRGHALYYCVEWNRDETVEAVASRYGVEADAVWMAGHDLVRHGVATVNVPVSHDRAERMLEALDDEEEEEDDDGTDITPEAVEARRQRQKDAEAAASGDIMFRGQVKPDDNQRRLANAFHMAQPEDVTIVEDTPGRMPIFEIRVHKQDQLEAAAKAGGTSAAHPELVLRARELESELRATQELMRHTKERLESRVATASAATQTEMSTEQRRSTMQQFAAVQAVREQKTIAAAAAQETAALKAQLNEVQTSLIVLRGQIEAGNAGDDEGVVVDTTFVIPELDRIAENTRPAPDTAAVASAESFQAADVGIAQGEVADALGGLTAKVATAQSEQAMMRLDVKAQLDDMHDWIRRLLRRVMARPTDAGVLPLSTAVTHDVAVGTEGGHGSAADRPPRAVYFSEHPTSTSPVAGGAGSGRRSPRGGNAAAGAAVQQATHGRHPATPPTPTPPAVRSPGASGRDHPTGGSAAASKEHGREHGKDLGRDEGPEAGAKEAGRDGESITAGTADDEEIGAPLPPLFGRRRTTEAGPSSGAEGRQERAAARRASQVKVVLQHRHRLPSVVEPTLSVAEPAGWAAAQLNDLVVHAVLKGNAAELPMDDSPPSTALPPVAGAQPRADLPGSRGRQATPTTTVDTRHAPAPAPISAYGTKLLASVHADIERLKKQRPPPLQGSLPSIAPPPPLPPRLAELEPVVEAIQKLHLGEVTPMQAEAVADMKRTDVTLRQETTALRFQQMRTGMDIKQLEQQLARGIASSTTDRRRVGQILHLWRRWLRRWNHRQRGLARQQRDNLSRLLDIFSLQSPSSPLSPLSRTLSRSGSAPSSRVASPQSPHHPAGPHAPNVFINSFAHGMSLSPRQAQTMRGPDMQPPQSTRDYVALAFGVTQPMQRGRLGRPPAPTKPANQPSSQHFLARFD